MHTLSRRIQAAALPTALTTSLACTAALAQGARAALLPFVDAERTRLSAVVVASGLQHA